MYTPNGREAKKLIPGIPMYMRMRMRHHIELIVLVCAMVLFSHPALAQFSQQGPKLVGTGTVGIVQQGQSVSISADGNTAIVGGYADNGLAGAAWVFTRSGGVWTQQGPKLVGSGFELTGGIQRSISVSLSADGNTAIIGASLDHSNAGAAWVFTRSGGVWTQQGPKLVGSGAVGGYVNQGFSVSLSADGNTAIIGGHGDNSGAGAAWVWTRSGGVWTQQGPKLVGSGAVGSAQQGWSVSLSADGNTAIVGGWTDNNPAGAAWVWTRSGGVWTQQGPKLVGSGGGANRQGFSVSLSADSNTAIVGATNGGIGTGAAWVWTRSGGVWTQQGPKLVGSDAVGSADQGISVSLSADGNTAIVGGEADNGNAGAAWVWTRSGGVWTQQGAKLVGSGASSGAQQGSSVSLSADGTTAIVGGPGDNNYAGAAWVFAASTSGCLVPGLPAVTGDALVFENSAPNAPYWSLIFPLVELYLDGTVAGLQSSNSALERTSGYRPPAYQQHFRDIRDRALAIDEAVSKDPIQESACFNQISTLKDEIDLHGLQVDPASPVGIPKVSQVKESTHTLVPARAMDLNTRGHLKGLIQPCVGGSTPDLVHYTLLGTPDPCKQSVQAVSFSPVAILVTDPLGRRIGFDPQQGRIINEIGTSASYTGLTEPQLITVDDVIPGAYLLSGISTGSGPYRLSLLRLDEDNEVLSEELRTGTTTVGATYRISTSIAKNITIDIKPGDRTTVINPRAQGTTPVALLSAPDFNPILAVNTGTLKFGPNGTEAAVIRCAADADLNGDRQQDLVCHFSTPAANFKNGQVQGVLTGTLLNGVSIMGIESIEVR